MDETLRKSLIIKSPKSTMEKSSSRKLEPCFSVEPEYINNLQKQVYLLELETSFLRNKARKVTINQPRHTAEAEQMISEVKDLQSQIDTMQVELSMKEATISAMKGEVESQRRHLQDISDANMREKSVLVEDVTQLEKLADVSVQDLTHKEGEQKSILHQLHGTIHSVKEKDRDLRLLQTQLQEQIKQQEAVEAQLAEKRSECLSIQAAVHQLEEQYLTTAHSVQDRIVSELRKEAEKLRTQLKERQLTADEDKYLRNKMMEACARLTRENGHLQSRVLETTKQLEEVLRLQGGRKSVEMAGSSLHKHLTDLQNKHSKVQQENSLLRVEKNHLVEHISQLHKQIAEKNDEIRRMQGHVDSLCYDMDSLKLRKDLDDSSDKEAWQQLSSISHNVGKLAAEMSLN
ncbi:uncharacterized protein LOC142652506 isoform X3 [Rhinoderma darwinii]|uniref:uncharacterized protein LOC142652506 isoform X3 n=1 Tax=Rhinoderma darwinii TaxID=43563 RepID=UPI003F6711DD